MRRSSRLATKSPKSYAVEDAEEAFFAPEIQDIAFESITPHVIQRRRIICSPRIVVFIASCVIVAMILFFPLNVEAMVQPRYPNFRRSTPPEPWLPV